MPNCEVGNSQRLRCSDHACSVKHLRLISHQHPRLSFIPHTHFLGTSRVFIGFEYAQSAPPPPCQKIGLAGVLVLTVLELIDEAEKGTEQGGTIVFDEIDEPGLLH